MSCGLPMSWIKRRRPAWLKPPVTDDSVGGILHAFFDGDEPETATAMAAAINATIHYEPAGHVIVRADNPNAKRGVHGCGGDTAYAVAICISHLHAAGCTVEDFRP